MRFRIIPADTFIWNLAELIDFLLVHQHQHIIIENGTEGCCARTVGLYQWLDKFKFASVTIETANVLETHPHYRIRRQHPWKFVKVQRAIDSNHHAWNKNTVFGTVYGRPLWHRLGIASHLLNNHAELSQVGFVADPKNVDRRELFELTQLWQHDPASLQSFSNIVDCLPCTHADVDEYTPGATLTDGFVAQTERIYKNFLIDIVAETFTSGNCFFITEKTIRPMLLKKPMIVMGSRNYLEYLRQMGFRTFSDFWSEDYDGFEGADRYLKILELIDTLANKSKDELETMYWDMQYTLDHNYNLLIDCTYNTTITQL
jgi:hypothetical protein